MLISITIGVLMGAQRPAANKETHAQLITRLSETIQHAEAFSDRLKAADQFTKAALANQDRAALLGLFKASDDGAMGDYVTYLLTSAAEANLKLVIKAPFAAPTDEAPSVKTRLRDSLAEGVFGSPRTKSTLVRGLKRLTQDPTLGADERQYAASVLEAVRTAPSAPQCSAMPDREANTNWTGIIDAQNPSNRNGTEYWVVIQIGSNGIGWAETYLSKNVPYAGTISAEFRMLDRFKVCNCCPSPLLSGTIGGKCAPFPIGCFTFAEDDGPRKGYGQHYFTFAEDPALSRHTYLHDARTCWAVPTHGCIRADPAPLAKIHRLFQAFGKHGKLVVLQQPRSAQQKFSIHSCK